MVRIEKSIAPANSKCCGCYQMIKRGVDSRIKIVTYKKDMILCEECYKELKNMLEVK